MLAIFLSAQVSQKLWKLFHYKSSILARVVLLSFAFCELYAVQLEFEQLLTAGRCHLALLHPAGAP